MPADPALRTLVVDDEPLAIERLQILCADLPGVNVVGTATDGAAALRLIAALQPDLLLLDIAMPDLDGMGVARAIAETSHPPAIVFCTAYDDHAVAAFDMAAADYVLKPVTADRLARAIGRARAARLAGSLSAQAPAYLTELWVPHRAEMVRLSVGDIDRIDAERDYMRLHVGGRSFLLHHTIASLARKLDPETFVRVHRSTIVRRDAITKLRHDGLGSWSVVLPDGTELRVGRTFLSAVKSMLTR